MHVFVWLSAYTKFYSTKTTLLSIHDHLSNAISMQQVSCLCLLDLSAAFDTLDHSILLHRLSFWFGIASVSLQWFTTYLSSRAPSIGIPTHSSPSSPLTCGVPQGSALGPVLFNLYITPLSSIISGLIEYSLCNFRQLRKLAISNPQINSLTSARHCL